MKEKYTIALCDILGFSRLVNSNTLELVVDDVLGWLRKAVYHSIHKNGWPDTVPSLPDIDKNSKIGIVWFSDTILLYTREDTNESLKELLQTVAWLLFATTTHGATRMRAGIAYGEAFIDPDNAMYVGRPIIDAYQMEQQQQWSGAALTESAVQRVPDFARTGELIDWPIVPYNVPLKNKAPLLTLAVNWTYGIHHTLPLRWSAENDEPSPEDWIRKASICEKWQNTKKFHSVICRQCRIQN